MLYKSFIFLLRFVYASLGERKYHIIVMMAFFSLATASEKVMLPYSMKYMVDALGRAKAGDALSGLYGPILLVVSVLVISELFYRASSFFMAHIYPKLERNMRRALYEHTMFHPVQFFMRTPIGDVGSKIYDLPLSCSSSLQMIVEVFLPIVVSLIATTGLVFTVSGLIGIVYVAWIAFHMLIAFHMNSVGARYAVEHGTSLNVLHGHIIDSLLNIINIKLFDNYHAESKNFDKYQDIEMQKNSKALVFMECAKLALCLLTIAEFVGVLYLVVHEWNAGRISTGDLVFILQVNVSTMSLMWWFTLQASSLVRAIGRALQAVSLMMVPNINNVVGSNISVTSGSIEYVGVDFCYPDNRQLFCGLNLKIKGGESVALIGLSGAGKTTLINLLLKSYAPQGGSILVDGQDISDISLRSLYSNITVVPQSVTLFNRSVFDNIRYGCQEASLDMVIEAAEKAHCHDFIMDLPHKYETIMNSEASLSSGQKQRILIARAILKDAPIVILDEATSALDNLTEMKVRLAILNLTKNKTAIIIAHRLSTVSIVDRVIVMNEGRIEGFDSPEELAKSSELFRILRDSCLI